jgi:hypothetical protein
MLQSFIHVADLRHWLGRPDCPLAIQEYKKLSDKWFGMSTNDKEHQSLSGDGISVQSIASKDIVYSKGASVPSDLHHLVSSIKITLQVQLMHNGVIYTHSSTHLGNSLVQFYGGGNVCSPLICGCIKYIFNLDGKIVFAIQCQLPASIGTVDLFNQYPHFHAALYIPGLAEELEIVEVGWVVCHYAHWQHSPRLALVLSLLTVCLACESLPNESILTCFQRWLLMEHMQMAVEHIQKGLSMEYRQMTVECIWKRLSTEHRQTAAEYIWNGIREDIEGTEYTWR